MGREQRQRFLRRLENGFDVGSDQVYNSWRSLVKLLGGINVDKAAPVYQPVAVPAMAWGIVIA